MERYWKHQRAETRNATIDKTISKVNEVMLDWIDDLNSPFIEVIHHTDKFVVEEVTDYTKKKLNKAEVRRGQIEFLRSKITSELSQMKVK